MPFERVFLAALVPDRRRALASQDENGLLIHVAHRFQLPSRWNFLHERIASAAGAVHVDKSRIASRPVPIAKFQLQ